MNPQDEFERWYRTAMGITVEKAHRRGMISVKMMREAFMAGMETEKKAASREKEKMKERGKA